MALTENTFTGEEFAAAVTANPALRETVTGYLTANKFVVQDEATHKTYLENYGNTIVGKKTGEHATSLEKDTFDLTGLPKNDGEKYYDYYKRAVSEKLKSVTDLQTEITALRAKDGATAHDQARIKQLQELLEKEKSGYSDQLKAKDTELANFKKQSQVEKAIAGYRSQYKSSIPKEVAEMSEAAIMEDAMKRAQVQPDGVITLLGDNGEVILNTQTYKPATIDEYIAGRMKPMLEEQIKQSGTGNKGENTPAPVQGERQEITALPAEVTSKVKLTEYLLKMGYVNGSTEFATLAMKFGEKLPFM